MLLASWLAVVAVPDFFHSESVDVESRREVLQLESLLPLPQNRFNVHQFLAILVLNISTGLEVKLAAEFAALEE